MLTTSEKRSYLALPTTALSLAGAAIFAHALVFMVSAVADWSLMAPKLMVIVGTVLMAGYFLRDMTVQKRSGLEPQAITLVAICLLVGLIQYHATLDAVVWGFFTCQCFVVVTLSWLTLFKRSW